jgi:acyl-coenzyme A thioesterase PaaI-like protein
LTSDLRVSRTDRTGAVDRRGSSGEGPSHSSRLAETARSTAPAARGIARRPAPDGTASGPAGGETIIEVAPHNCFACGTLNEHGLHLDLHVDGDRCWSEVRLRDDFQGWDGIAHGGIVCTILDEVMAWSLASSDNWGVTVRLNVEFRKPVPLGTTIRAEGWITDNRRRVIETAARILDGSTGALLAGASATYVAASADRKKELQARYGLRFRRPDEPSTLVADAGLA